MQKQKQLNVRQKKQHAEHLRTVSLHHPEAVIQEVPIVQETPTAQEAAVVQEVRVIQEVPAVPAAVFPEVQL